MHNKKFVPFAIVIMIILLASCASPTSTPDQPILIPEPTNVDDSAQEFISSENGGNLEQGDIAITIPSGALSSDQTVSITVLPAKPVGEEEGIVIPGDVYAIEAEQEIFEAPITITIEYDEAQLPEGRSEGEIFGVFLYEGSWVRKLGEVDKDKNTLTLHTIHLSDWSWGFEEFVDAGVTPHATAMNCIQNVIDPLEVPKTLSDAYELKGQRLQEWKDTVSALDMRLNKLDISLQQRLDELGFKWMPKMQGDLVWEEAQLASMLLGVKDLDKLMVVTIGKGIKTIIGAVDIIRGVYVSLETDMVSGEVLADMVKVKEAEQRYMAAKAYVYLFENPDAKTVPPEYLSALQAICSETPQQSTVDTGEAILIPAGEFQMGCDPAGHSCYQSELPLHTVYLDAYLIDRYELTNAQYERCVDSGACTPPASYSSFNHSEYFGNPEFEDYPVVYVDWNQANTYCIWAGGRLPTEAEWEKAARGSQDTRAFPWGDANPDCTLANGEIGALCVGDTSAVGSYPAGASPYGMMDMAGNVWEWINDWYQDYYSSSPSSNPTGAESGNYKLLRGGSWGYGMNYLRVSARFYSAPTGAGDNIGFRCARSP